MNRYDSIVTLTFAVAMAAALTGCGTETEAPADNGFPELPPATIDLHHDHPSEGPHHGHLIELGRDDYHAELVHDEAQETVTVYILDGSATKSVAIDAPALLINVRHGSGAEQYQLTASPNTGDPSGRSSRFASHDRQLGQVLHDEHADARLVVKIDGKAFSGNIEHDHHAHDHEEGHGQHHHDHDSNDHDGHDHAHHEEGGHHVH